MKVDFVTVFKRLLPNGKPWLVPFNGDFDKFITAMSKEAERSEEFFNGVLNESIPNTASQLVDEWTDIYGINPDLPEETRKNLALSYYTSTGNQSESYIEEQLLKTGFLVDLIEQTHGNSECGVAECGVAECGGWGVIVIVEATVTVQEEVELRRLVEYYKPLHITVVYNISRPVGFIGGGLPFGLAYDGLGGNS